MPQANIYLDEREGKVIERYSKKWGLNKHDTIRRIIREKGEEKDAAKT